MAMYTDWLSAKDIPPSVSFDHVLQTYPPGVGRSVVQSIVKSIVDAGQSSKPIPLHTHAQVTWTMQVLGHGLTLPLQDYVDIQRCVDIYSDWLMAAVHRKGDKQSIPLPLFESPEHYITIMFSQYFSSLFVDKRAEGNLLNHQVNLCRTILEITHSTLKEASLSCETWGSIMTSLLKVADMLLAVPAEPMSLGEQLSDDLVFVVFDLWLRMCASPFPSPSLWKALRESCISWRHHPEVVRHWSALMISLTKRVIGVLYSPGNCIFVSDPKVDFGQSASRLAKDALVQCWFRMLHTIGNPVELSYPHMMAQSPAFQQVLSDEPAPTWTQPAALDSLKDIFHSAMTCISQLVDMFLSVNPPQQQQQLDPAGDGGSQQSSPMIGVRGLRGDDLSSKGMFSTLATTKPKAPLMKTPSHPTPAPFVVLPANLSASSGDVSRLASPFHRASVGGSEQGSVSHSDGLAHPSTGSLWASLSKGKLPSKPRGATLLHLFGAWLFEAVIWHNSKIPHKSPSAVHFEPGRAVALGTLCRIFCSQSPQEHTPSVYLARFYQAVSIGLDYDSKIQRGALLVSVVLNTANLFRIGLPGVNVLALPFLTALGQILCKDHISFECKVNWQDIRSSAIQILLSILPLPLHFQQATVTDLNKVLASRQAQAQQKKQSISEEAPNEVNEKGSVPRQTFLSLHLRLQQLVNHALDSETDPQGMQYLLCGLGTLLQDTVSFEKEALKRQKLANKHQKEPEPSLATGGEEHKNTKAQVREDQPKGEGQLEEKGRIPEVIITHGSVSQDEGVGHGSSRAPLRGVKETANTESLLEEGFTQQTIALYKKAISMTSLCLKEWDSNFCVTLSALSLLSSLASLSFEDRPLGDIADSKRVASLLCEFIKKHASKEGLSHSRDLHTMLVAAFWAILQWIIHRQELISDKEMLSNILSVIELGISGSTSESQGEDGDIQVVFKGDKEIKPLSGRTGQIAEYLLISLMEKTGVSNGGTSGCAALDEDTILSKLPAQKEGVNFQYFVIDGAYILGLLEDSPIPSSSGNLPQLTAIVRGPSGTHVWAMEMRHKLDSEPEGDDHLKSAPRPLPLAEIEREPMEPRRPWPEEVELRTRVKADSSIPDIHQVVDKDTLDRVVQQAQDKVDLEMKRAVEFKQYLNNLLYPDPSLALDPPKARDRFHTARLFLSQMGYLDLEKLTKEEVSDRKKSIVLLNSTHAQFRSALKSLDSVATRYTNTVFMLYVKEGQTRPQDILSNNQGDKSFKSQEFYHLLDGLGWKVDPATHTGFKGKLHPLSEYTAGEMRPLAIGAQIPFKPFVYFADLTMEIAFVLPTLKQSRSTSSSSLRSTESVDSAADTIQDRFPTPSLQRTRQGSGVSQSLAQASAGGSIDKSIHSRPVVRDQSIEPPPAPYHTQISHRSKKYKRTQDCAVVVAWLESINDMNNFPIRQLSQSLHGLMPPPPVPSSVGSQLHISNKVYAGKPYLPVIFVYPLPSGLYRIQTWIPATRHSLIGPLLDGMVVCKHVLPLLIRQTAINICTAYRVDAEDYKPPTALRRQRIEEIAGDYSRSLSAWELHTEVFAASP